MGGKVPIAEVDPLRGGKVRVGSRLRRFTRTKCHDRPRVIEQVTDDPVFLMDCQGKQFSNSGGFTYFYTQGYRNIGDLFY